ncbi:hypothetical protein P0Y35_09325 [Kiritimatiellaeota bacterium B1221]|nr:hypothetical protein [Kiritimatiellaeota bacterium B1221]
MSTVWAGVGEKRKRGLRILPKKGGYFVHVTSRTVGQAFLFGETEKRVFIRIMRNWAGFSGITVLTHCLMDNHFHALVWVPGKVCLEHSEVISCLKRVWSEEKVRAWEDVYRNQDAKGKVGMDEAVMQRMANLPEFMRVVKQSFTRWYNGTHDRKGVLWDSRYRSVVVEGSPLALMSVAAYIDLNPVRAGMVQEPMHYPWSGIGAAMSGDIIAQEGLKGLVCLARGLQPNAAIRVRKKQIANDVAHWREVGPRLAAEHAKRAKPRNWQEVVATYRIWLVSKGERTVKHPKGLDPVQILEVYEKQGAVPFSQLLRCRMRSFTRGVALGAPEFLEEVMGQYRSCFGAKRKVASRRVKGCEDAWMSLRQVD